MSAAPPTTDPADEAGGEIVYSSDGLSPVPKTKPPPIAAANKGITSDEAILDSDDISPEAAFEVFKGRVYSVQTVSRQRLQGGVGAEESPLERLARLQTEVADLESQFRSASNDSGRDFDEQLVELATDLRGRLIAASTMRILEQEDLTRMIRNQIEILEKQNDASKPKGSSTTPGSGIIYELYGPQPNSTRQPPTSSLEERILKLETALGSSTTAPAGSGTISSTPTGVGKASVSTFASRLDELEALIATVDPAQLEQASTKAKVIRADLEAASKARNKLTATYKKEDSKMIQQLHQQMVDLEGLSGYLPKLVERLQQLSSLHVQASTFGARLEELERSANQVEGTVASLETTMGELQTSMKSNLLVMEENLKKLDDRMKTL